MHEYRRFIQEQMDQRGWRQADLVRASGLSRALVSRILTDTRLRLGQMPDESTMVGIAKAFSVSPEMVRTAAARALRGYADDGEALTTDLKDVSLDALLGELRRRVEDSEDQGKTSTPSTTPTHGEAGIRRAPMNEPDISWPATAGHLDDPTGVVQRLPSAEPLPDAGLDEPLPYAPAQLHAARDLDGMSDGEKRRLPGRDGGEESQDPGDDWEGA